jgi:D-alanyl-D-alanine endopeptidase (penicillin-binding protein 7)
MTAAVVFEGHPDLTREVAVERSDVARANHTYLRAGERVTIDDLLHLTLVASDNAAARALARTSPLGPAGFIKRMNEKALELGLEHTTYADPSGLLSANVSSAYDMARLISFASADERVASIMRKAHYTVLTSRRVININNTNQLLVKGDVDVRGGKTGFISKAGYCLATLLRLPQTNQQVAVVVLGARSNAGRFMETRHLFQLALVEDPGPDAAQQRNPRTGSRHPGAGTVAQPSYPRWVAAASSGSVAIASTVGRTGREAPSALYALRYRRHVSQADTRYRRSALWNDGRRDGRCS